MLPACVDELPARATWQSFGRAVVADSVELQEEIQASPGRQYRGCTVYYLFVVEGSYARVRRTVNIFLCL